MADHKEITNEIFILIIYGETMQTIMQSSVFPELPVCIEATQLHRPFIAQAQTCWSGLLRFCQYIFPGPFIGYF